IKTLLNLDESERRNSILAAQLGTQLKFEPRRRQDVDCLFLAAQVKSARQIKPQINFYRGHDVPVYATSHVYNGKKDPVNDADLNGIIFGDMPWLLNDQGRMPALRERIQKDWPDQYTPMDRLYALGMDAYAIIFHLPRLISDPTARISGATANLSLVDNRINRYLTWARFEQGRPVVKDVIIEKKGIESISLESRSLETDPAPAKYPAPATRTVGGS
ncbi:MAG TPA: penicillin-binding protein activator, partial [Paracoccaceae bacterium]|nr:penicillin-binding protein activator [Paracoccaceae bacterium]